MCPSVSEIKMPVRNESRFFVGARCDFLSVQMISRTTTEGQVTEEFTV